MIEKVVEEILTIGGRKVANLDIKTVANKVNEIIDILNAIVIETKDGTFIDGSKKAEPVDPYAEQRKWIGKLCKFWDNDGDEKWFSVLEHIDKNKPYPYRVSGDWWYKHCEPVTEDLIYKGE